MAKHDLENIMEIGEALFRTQGYYHTGTKEILQKGNFPRSSFYHHFTDKEGFALKIIDRYGTKSVEMYKNILLNQSISSPKARFQFFFSNMSLLASNGDFKSQCLIQKMSGECAGLEDEIRKKAEEQLEAMVGVFRDCITEGQEIGEFRNDKPAMDMARFLHAQLYGGSTLARLTKKKSDMEKTLAMALEYLLS